ncbi:hypothetical protein [Streptomyces sp. S1D4-14]|uniref:hypothetical protein n=1 Tax=Streptomyces sp. S1D4-14 TaxID=2594461 RepID=UPI001163919A|nr:hypothetical protein [Streptomyces sp. S1D4-14]QDN64485.1 hypothetical protein FNV66_01230 [Streptomyces sp. S1D4-14]
MVSESTRTWCAARGHALITYIPFLDQTLCRCGWRREQGDQPQDMEAKRAVFHACKPGETCRCYVGGKHDTV